MLPAEHQEGHVVCKYVKETTSAITPVPVQLLVNFHFGTITHNRVQHTGE